MTILSSANLCYNSGQLSESDMNTQSSYQEGDSVLRSHQAGLVVSVLHHILPQIRTFMVRSG